MKQRLRILEGKKLVKYTGKTACWDINLHWIEKKMFIKNNKIHVCELGVLINLFNIIAKNIF